MNVKSERLKKLELELKDLEQWMHLGLVPKKDIEKHKGEIELIRGKIEEEKQRLQYIKESGELEEYIAPKRNPQARSGFQDAHTIPDINIEDSQMTDSGIEYEQETQTESDTVSDGSDDSQAEDFTSFDDEDDPFSDKNRWRRGILEDPESDDW